MTKSITLAIMALTFSFSGDLSCDQTINKDVIQICYNYQVKGPLVSYYTLTAKQVNENNIKKRPRFYKEKNLAGSKRTTYADYTHGTSVRDIEAGRVQHYDRGHLAPDASFDYNQKALNKVYTMANIIPQVDIVNRKTWIKAEKYERLAANSSDVKVWNLVEYNDLSNYLVKLPIKQVDISKWNLGKKYGYINKAKVLQNKKIVVPSGFYKIISAGGIENSRVFYYANVSVDAKKDKLKNHLVKGQKKEWVIGELKRLGVLQ